MAFLVDFLKFSQAMSGLFLDTTDQSTPFIKTTILRTNFAKKHYDQNGLRVRSRR